MRTVLITGAAGNLGGLLADYLKESGLKLNLLIHKKDVKQSLKEYPNISVFRADLNDANSLTPALIDVDTVVHFAGVLFKHHPEKFLPKTNISYFKNLVEKALENNIKRIILISFPHVEGETSVKHPANGKLYGNPNSVHAKTRLGEEIFLFETCKKAGIEAVILRSGMVYGKGILMIEAARWFAKYRLLGVWKKPTLIHLISTPDFLETTKQAIVKDNIKGIFHLGDDGLLTLQEFLDTVTKHWHYKKPWRMPLWLILLAAETFEISSFLFGIKSPLTKDFIKIGMSSYYGDTGRMRNELLYELKHKTLKDGIHTL